INNHFNQLDLVFPAIEPLSILSSLFVNGDFRTDFHRVARDPWNADLVTGTGCKGSPVAAITEMPPESRTVLARMGMVPGRAESFAHKLPPFVLHLLQLGALCGIQSQGRGDFVVGSADQLLELLNGAQ